MTRAPSGAVLRFAVVAAVLLAIVGLDRSVAARTTPGQETYLQFNMCGNVCNRGGVAVVRSSRWSSRGSGRRR